MAAAEAKDAGLGGLDDDSGATGTIQLIGQDSKEFTVEKKVCDLVSDLVVSMPMLLEFVFCSFRGVHFVLRMVADGYLVFRPVSTRSSPPWLPRLSKLVRHHDIMFDIVWLHWKRLAVLR